MKRGGPHEPWLRLEKFFKKEKKKENGEKARAEWGKKKENGNGDQLAVEKKEDKEGEKRKRIEQISWIGVFLGNLFS